MNILTKKPYSRYVVSGPYTRLTILEFKIYNTNEIEYLYKVRKL